MVQGTFRCDYARYHFWFRQYFAHRDTTFDAPDRFGEETFDSTTLYEILLTIKSPQRRTRVDLIAYGFDDNYNNLLADMLDLFEKAEYAPISPGWGKARLDKSCAKIQLPATEVTKVPERVL